MEGLGENNNYFSHLEQKRHSISLGFLLFVYNKNNSFSATGGLSGMEYNATAFVGCDNGYVST